jgi:GTPase Era involved in 16S rRNA processing
VKLNEVKQEIMEIVQGRDQDTCLDIAERIEDLLSDITLGLCQDEWTAEQCLDFIEREVGSNLTVLINKLQKEENEKRNNGNTNVAP